MSICPRDRSVLLTVDECRLIESLLLRRGLDSDLKAANARRHNESHYEAEEKALAQFCYDTAKWFHDLIPRAAEQERDRLREMLAVAEKVCDG